MSLFLPVFTVLQGIGRGAGESSALEHGAQPEDAATVEDRG